MRSELLGDGVDAFRYESPLAPIQRTLLAQLPVDWCVFSPVYHRVAGLRDVGDALLWALPRRRERRVVRLSEKAPDVALPSRRNRHAMYEFSLRAAFLVGPLDWLLWRQLETQILRSSSGALFHHGFARSDIVRRFCDRVGSQLPRAVGPTGGKATHHG